MADHATSTEAARRPSDTGADDEAAQEEKPEPVPEDIMPLFFTTLTQQIFECTSGTDVTGENPWKLIQKEKILEDFKNRAAISDFHPAKQTILDYPSDELLVVYDDGYKYGQNFYLCLTEEAKERVLNPPSEDVAESPEAEEEAPLAPPVSERPIKPWVSLGSDVEIQEEQIMNSRKLISYVISRKSKHFGQPFEFSDSNASSTPKQYEEYQSYEENNFNLQQMEKDIGVQAVAELVDDESQTNWIVPRNAATQYFPRELSESEQGQAMKSEEVQSLVHNVVQSVELALQQNIIMDVFVDDFLELPEYNKTNFGNKSDRSLKEYQSFTDLQFSKDKTITCIDWHPSITGVVAVSCAERLSFDGRIDQAPYLITQPSLVLIWSFVDPIHPQLMLEAPDDIFTFQFNPSNPNHIAGGCLNGQVVLWDISTYEDRLRSQKESGRGDKNKTATLLDDEKPEHAPMVRYCAVSSIEHGHSMCIEDLQWIPDHFEINRMGTVLENQDSYCNQLITCSTDGTVRIWDTRPLPQKHGQKEAPNMRALEQGSVSSSFKYLDLVWKPLIEIPLSKSRGTSEFAAVTVSIQERQQGPVWALRTKAKGTPSQASIKPQVQDTVGKSETETPSEKPAPEVLDNINSLFYVGTEDGEIVYISWKMEKDPESGRAVASKPIHTFSPHCGPVRCVQRSPFMSDVILTVGGWDFCVWKEGLHSGPLLKSACASVQLTGGHWSPTRAGVFFIARADGNIEVWDLLERSHEPAKVQNVSAAPITCIFPFHMRERLQLLAVGDHLGTLHIVEIPWSYKKDATNEVASIEGFFDREVKRLQYFEERARNRAEAKSQSEAAPVVVGMNTINSATVVCFYVCLM
jgi:WD40 repeat protein